MESMGTLLESGNGRSHKALATWWFVVIVVGGIGAVIFYITANKLGIDEAVTVNMFGYSNTVREASKNEMYSIFMCLVALCVVAVPIEGYFMHTRISRTDISVHEKGIKGSSVVPNFPLSFFLYCSLASLRLADFQLTYDLISSVDVVDGNTLIINTRDVKHKIYAMNAREIRDAIMSQKSKQAGGN